MSITLFTNLYENKPHYSSVEKALSGIKTGGRQIDLIKQIRETTDKEERNQLKKRLGVICFGGKFSERKASALVEYSRLVCLDFDGVNVPVKRLELISIPFVHAVFVSPSGDGLKALIKVSSDNHLGHFKALSKEIKGVDESGKDVCRACFFSFDPEIYVNEHSNLYTKVVEAAYNDDQKLDKLKKWLDNQGSHFVSGNRNNFLAKLAGACNRFGMSEDFVISKFISTYASSDFKTREIEMVVRSIYRSYPADHGSASFDESFSEARTTEILSSEVKTSDVIYLGDVEKDLINDYENGTQGGGTTYFPTIDDHYRPLRGDLNVLSGIGNFGKSAIQKQLDIVSSVKEGRKHVYFSPEEQPPLFWYRELIRTYIGKPLEREDPKRMTMIEYKRGMEFVREHFFFVYPKSLPSPDYMLERFAEILIKHGADSCTIDPWNQLLHIMEKRDDIYLGETLTKFERFAQQQAIFFNVICHPNRTIKASDGNYACPDVYDLNGGPTWNARATNICVYHRPFYGTDKTDPSCEFHSKKIKRQLISGIPGVAPLDYKRQTGRFYDNGFNPLG